MGKPGKTSSNLEYLGREPIVDAEFAEVDDEAGAKPKAPGGMARHLSHLGEAIIRLATTGALLIGVAILIAIVAHFAGLKLPSGASNEIAVTDQPSAFPDAPAVPPSQSGSSGVVTADSAPDDTEQNPGEVPKAAPWPALQAHPGKFYSYTLSEGRDYPLTVIVNGDAGLVPGDPNVRSATVSQVAYSVLGGAILADTMIFDCNAKTTSIVQRVTMSELMGTNTKVYNAETIERKPLDAVTTRAFNMVCNNGWDRLAEMIVPEAGIEGFIQARLKAIN